MAVRQRSRARALMVRETTSYAYLNCRTRDFSFTPSTVIKQRHAAQLASGDLMEIPGTQSSHLSTQLGCPSMYIRRG